MKSKAITIFLIFVMLLSVPSINAKEDGIINKSVNGCSCHGGGEGNAEVTINLPEEYNSGQSYSLEISVISGGFSSGGFNLAVSDGTLTTNDPNTKIQSGQAVHSNANTNTWTVDWMAPAQGSGTVTFTLAGLAADGNGQKTNDGWATISLDVLEADSAPEITNVQILPSNPTSSDSLKLSYDYDDDRNQPDSSSIAWFKDGVINSQGSAQTEGIMEINFSYTLRGEVWSVQIMPNDGTNSGDIITLEVTILNSKPVISNLAISPSGPSQNDDLTATWQEYDEDDDDLTSTIKWYKDNVHQTELDGVTTISKDLTEENEEWYFSVTLNDSFEEQIENSSKVILNMINDVPTLENIQIENIEPTTDLDLLATWAFLDGDGDEQSGFETKWYLNDVHQLELDNLLTVESQYTSKGELWFFQVRATDGIEFSEWYQSVNVEINNSIPEITADIIPNSPTNNTNLTLNITTTDLDNDILDIEVDWIKNNTIFSTITSSPFELSSNETKTGEVWYANITINDGEISTTYSTEPVTIFPNPITNDDEILEDFKTTAYVQSITYGILTMTTFMLVQFLLSVKATKEGK